MEKHAELMTVRDVMTADVVSIPPSTPFKEVVTTLRGRRIAAVPVTDALGQVVGVVSETDLLPKEEPPNIHDRHFFDTQSRRQLRRRASALRAVDLMSTPAVTVRPEEGLREAARLLVEKHVHQLPVVDGSGTLVGIVSRGDVLRVFARDDEDIRKEVIKDVLECDRWLDSCDVEVTVEGGVVVLKGQLERRNEVTALVSKVREVDGVVGVMDKLCYRFDDSTLNAYEQAVLAPFSPSWGNGGL